MEQKRIITTRKTVFIFKSVKRSTPQSTTEPTTATSMTVTTINTKN